MTIKTIEDLRKDLENEIDFWTEKQEKTKEQIEEIERSYVRDFGDTDALKRALIEQQTRIDVLYNVLFNTRHIK